MDIPDPDKTSLNEITNALLQGKATEEEQEAAGQFIVSVLGLAESAIKFTQLLETNEWMAEEDEEKEQWPKLSMN